MIISLKPGDTLTVLFHDHFDNSTNDVSFTDGSFTIAFKAVTPTSGGAITVHAELPDQHGNQGLIYEETFGIPDFGDEPVPVPGSTPAPVIGSSNEPAVPPPQLEP